MKSIQKYKRIYDNLIQFRKLNKPSKEICQEVHHIIPRSLGGSDDPENLVQLTAREHFIQHKLLTKIHPNSREMWTQFWLMCNIKEGNRDYRVTSRDFQIARENHNKHSSKYMSKLYSNGNAFNQDRRGYTTNGVNRKMFLQHEIPSNENWILCERFNEIFPEFPKSTAKKLLKINQKSKFDKICLNCSKEFFSKVSNKVCCSLECSDEYRYMARIIQNNLTHENVANLLEHITINQVQNKFKIENRNIRYLLSKTPEYIQNKIIEINEIEEITKPKIETKYYNENVKPTEEQINFQLKVYEKYFNELKETNKILDFSVFFDSSSEVMKFNLSLNKNTVREKSKQTTKLQNPKMDSLNRKFITFEKACLCCSETFQQQSSRTKYCSNKCQSTAKYERAQSKVKFSKEELQELLWSKSKDLIYKEHKLHHTVLKVLIERYDLTEPPVGYFLSKDSPNYVNPVSLMELPQSKEILQKEVFEVSLQKLQEKHNLKESTLVSLLDFHEIERPDRMYWKKHAKRQRVNINLEELQGLKDYLSIKELQEHFECSENTIKRKLSKNIACNPLEL